MHDARSHLALDGTPGGDAGWCQPSENTSSMFKHEDDRFIFTAALCSRGAVTHSSTLLCSTRFFYNVLGAAQGQGRLGQFVVLGGALQINMTSVETFYHLRYVFNHWCMLGSVDVRCLICNLT